ncbi:MAG: tetratricopeptide repeat protein [Acidimicrobiales bacterium]
MDVTDATFEADVLERSSQVPIVVDLWASWCGPCRTLGPILEKVIGETDGTVELVKVDVDANPRVAATFQVQSIPAVYAIADRKVVDSFVGALPESQVRQWVAKLAPEPSEVDRLLDAGDEASLRQALQLEPANDTVAVALAALLVAADTAAGKAEALTLFERVPETAETRHLGAQARVGDEVVDAGGEDVTSKLDALLERVKADDEARREFVDLLEVLGPDDPRTAGYRKALTTRLF